MIFCLESTTACMSEWSFFSSSSTAINLHDRSHGQRLATEETRGREGGERERGERERTYDRSRKREKNRRVTEITRGRRAFYMLIMVFICRSLSSCSLSREPRS